MERAQYQAIVRKLNFNVSPWGWIRVAAVDLLAVGGAIGLYNLGEWPGRDILSAFVVGCLMFRGFSAMHDGVHGALSSNRALNNWLGVIWGGVCFLPYNQWKKGHLDHHQWAGNVEKDPVMKLCLYIKNGKKMPWFIELSWRLWFPILAVMQQVVFWWNCFIQVKKGLFSKIDLASLVMPLMIWGIAAAALGLGPTVKILIPGALFYLLLVEAVNFPHHLELPQYGGEHRIATYNQHEIARSCTYTRWLEHFVLLGFNYHVEHHLFPTLPWHQLAKAHVLLKEALGAQYNMESGFTWVLRNKRRSLTQVLYDTRRTESIPIVEKTA